MRSVLVVPLVAACSTPGVLEARKLPDSAVADAQAVVEANNAFACDLYAVLRADPAAPANFFLSPFSLSTSLAMIDAGAAGDTDAQLRAALHETGTSAQVADGYHALLASLATGTRYGGYTLQTADRLFGQQGFPFQPGYLKLTKDDYGAELMPVDFAGDPVGATSAIDD